ncbi:hypothetical protein TNCV_2114891 [Trichonephila clavipes]|nr:hypothetical protein TNCV_2114891 [Trichonephila clavipes]
MLVSFVQRLFKLLHQIRGAFAGIECKQATSGLLGASRHVYGHQNTARRAEIRLKRRHCATPLSSLVVRCTRVAVSLYAALSRKAKVMATVLTYTGLAANMLISD